MSLGLFDVLGPIMHGPSSNHTGGANRIGYYAHLVMGGTPDQIELGFHPAYMDSFYGQQSHTALIAGCLGYREYENMCINSLQIAKSRGISWTVVPISETGLSRNTMRVTGWIAGDKYIIDADSVGGGNIVVNRINDLSVELTGNEYAIILVSSDRNILEQAKQIAVKTLGEDCITEVSGQAMGKKYLACVSALSCTPKELFGKLRESIEADKLICRIVEPLYTFRDVGNIPLITTFADALRLCVDKDFPQLAIEYEMQHSGVTREQILEHGRKVVCVIKDSLQRGAAEGPKLIGGLVDPDDGKKLLRFSDSGRTSINKLFTLALARAVILAEQNASSCRIVACPTGGSAGTLPAALVTAAERYGKDDEELVKAFLVAALVGVIIGNKASFSGTIGGCQSEVGIASAMGAAAIAWLAGGMPEQIVNAGTIALKNVLGLTCDPPASPVEVPCIKRNAMGVAIAFYGADMGLAGIRSAITPDDVVLALVDTQKRMPAELKHSLTGGLASTSSGRALNKQWQHKMDSTCIG